MSLAMKYLCFSIIHQKYQVMKVISVVVNTFPEICDSICVCQTSKNNESRAVLFLKMNEGYCLNRNLQKRVQNAISSEMSKLYLPSVIVEVTDIPVRRKYLKLFSIFLMIYFFLSVYFLQWST